MERKITLDDCKNITNSLHGIEYTFKLVEVPSYVFKYRSLNYDHIDHALSIIKDHALFFSPRKQLNDRYDCLHRTTFNSKDDLIQHYLDLMAKNNITDEIIINNILNLTIEDYYKMQNAMQKRTDEELGVLAFSQRGNIRRLWHEYADEGKGICYIFSTNDLHVISPLDVNGNPKDFDRYYIVAPVFYCASKKVGVPINESDMKVTTHYYFTKSLEWEHEKEYRCLSINAQGIRTYYPKSLVGVIYGENTSNENKSIIRNLLNEYYKVHQHKVSEYQALLLGNKVYISRLQ